MKFLNLIYTGINAETFNNSTLPSKINTNIDLSNIEQLNLDLTPKDTTILKISFNFSLNFQENIANILLKGVILIEIDSKEAETVLKNWKSKKVEGGFKLTMFNIILRKCSIKALELEDELGLPPHFPLPSFEKKKKEE